MKKTVFTILLTLIVPLILLVVYVESGIYDISQLTPHNALTKLLIKTTTRNSIKRRMKNIEVPVTLGDSALIVKGFSHYNEMCSGCHGAPGIEQGEIVKGLYPQPPKIYRRVKKDDAQEFFWIISNGIKMTSMPAYKPTHTDAEIWAITAFVTQKLGSISPEEYKSWTKKYSKHDNDMHSESEHSR